MAEVGIYPDGGVVLAVLEKDESSLNHDSALIPEDIEQQPRREVIQSLEAGLKGNRTFSLEVGQSLIKRLINEKKIAKNEGVSFESGIGGIHFSLSKNWQNEHVRAIDILSLYVLPILERMPLSEQEEFSEWIAPLLSEVPNNLGDPPFIFQYLEFIKRSEDSELLAKPLVEYVYKNKNDYHYSDFYFDNYSPQELSATDSLMEALTHRMMPQVLEITANETDQDKQQTLLGMFVDRYSLSFVTDQMRALVHNEPDEGKRSQLERMGKTLLGLSPDDSRTFYTALKDLYSSIQFEHYKPNIEANKEDLSLISKVVHEYEDPVVIDLACGTGRISNEIAKDTTIKNIYGIDNSEVNLETARHGDETQKVIYQNGTWTDIDLPDSSTEVVACIGRSLCHVRNQRELGEVFKEVSRVLKPGGTFIFDFPDPNKGEYLENRKKYLKILQSLNFPLPGADEEMLSVMDHVIDSPDDRVSLYDRYTPDFQKVIDEQNRSKLHPYHNLVFQELKRELIPSGKGDETIYYVGKKIEPPAPVYYDYDEDGEVIWPAD